MIARRTLSLFAVGALALGACGGDPAISTRAERTLQTGYEAVTAAVAAADRPGARSALRDLERSVAELTDGGQIDAGRAQEILAAAEDVATQLSLLPAPSPSASPSPEPEPTQSDERGDGGEQGPGNSGNNGNGHAYGHENGNGNSD